MSNNIGYFEDNGKDDGQPMCVTAFVDKDWDASVQFTIGIGYSTLDSFDVRKLVDSIDECSTNVELYGYEVKDSTSMRVSYEKQMKGYMFSIGTNHCILCGEDINQLIHMLICRLYRIEGFRATD